MGYAETIGSEPVEMVRPDSISAVADAVRAAHDAGRAIVPLGGGSGQDFGGRLADKPYTLLDLGGLNRVVDHQVGDLTITVEAGARVADVQKVLAAHGQFLPLDVPSPETATIGGVLATDASGLWRLGYGGARDYLIGITVVDGLGRVVKGGGKVVKNVTGYDLPKLHVGALGTLGVIVEATFRLSPRPETVRTLVAQAGPMSEIASFFRRLLDETDPIQAFWHADSAGKYAVVLYHGPDEATLQQASRAANIAHGSQLMATVFEDDLASEFPDAPLAARATLLPASLPRFLDLVETAVENRLSLDAQFGVGVVTVRWPDSGSASLDSLRAFRSLCVGSGAKFSVTRAPLAIRDTERAQLWAPLPSSIAFHRRLKESLDPENVLNPGRFVDGI